VEVPLASLSRVMYSSVQPARVARGVGVSSGGGRSTPSSVLSSLVSRVHRVSLRVHSYPRPSTSALHGVQPKGRVLCTFMDTLLFYGSWMQAILALTVTTAGIAAVRAKIRAVRECSTCHGYGVQRCKLCSGKGTIEWEGKLAHREPCPMCLGRRFNNCTCCGGGTLFARHLFNHKHSNPVDAGLVDNLQSLAKEGRLSRWAAAIPPALRLRRTVSDQEERRELSQQFAEEIMTD